MSTLAAPAKSQGTGATVQGVPAPCDGIAVPAGGDALQKALAAAPTGARLCLEPGIHTGGLALDKSVTLVGTAGAAQTTIRGPGRFGVLRIDKDGLLVRLEGLTLEKGVADAGAGLAVRGRGKVAIVDCVLRANKAGMAGGGAVYARYGLLTVERTRFEGNRGRQGGAVLLDTVKAEFTRCTFADNAADVGGAVRVIEGVDVQFKGCEFRGNTALNTDTSTLLVSGIKSMEPKVELQSIEADGGLTNGPEIAGAIRIQSSKVPTAWRALKGVRDGGGNTWR
ncbi:MAG: hypothetical protein EXR79_09240 [Myxococcales bacterium]|nr:hypothetical protein [Myxococcales bacterium]